MKSFIPFIVAYFMLGAVFGQTETKVVPSTGTASDFSATSVDIWDKYAILGAPEDDPAGAESGSVTFYELEASGWVEKQTIYPSDISADDQFGYSVSISGEWAAVGARFFGPTATDTDGKVYIYHRDASGVWSQFTAFENNSLDQFGTSVSLDGSYLAVGSIRTSDPNNSYTETGSAVIYRYNNSIWVKEAELFPSDGAYDDQFGTSISLQDTILIIGSPYQDPGGLSQAGAAYVYTRSGAQWNADTKLTAPTPASSDFYGISVAVYGNKTLVGSYYSDPNGSKSGTAFFYTKPGTTWSLTSTITDGNKYDNFGVSVAFVDGSNAIVGARKHQGGAAKAGAAFLYQFDSGTNSWIANTVTSKVAPSDGAKYDYFGSSVAGYGDYLFIGSLKDDDDANSNNKDVGSSYFYDVSAAILPVQLVDFKAEVIRNKEVALTWDTESEINNEGFEVQHSVNGLDWQKIGWVDGIGNSDQFESYRFLDENPQPNASNYYRLKQVDYDGKFTLSEVVAAYIQREVEFKVFPNPASDYVTIEYDDEKGPIEILSVFDLSGRLKIQADPNQKEIDISGLSSGNYLIFARIMGQNLSQSIYKK